MYSLYVVIHWELSCKKDIKSINFMIHFHEHCCTTFINVIIITYLHANEELKSCMIPDIPEHRTEMKVCESSLKPVAQFINYSRYCIPIQWQSFIFIIVISSSRSVLKKLINLI